ncbi:MAG: type II secretion system protein [Kiritimatiellales bacterium]|nr:type II secretion system protein [Kiritimatiellota bacterium]MBL7012285.1 type II secretion system protein [Kiritimatiellales bacterium]
MKIKKQGFTLVEIMIVVAIIGLLAAIGIPSILGAYSTSQKKAKARNVAEVEKAKGVLTLPTSSGLPGAMELDDTTLDLSTGAAYSNLMSALSITDASELTVGADAVTIGTLATKASYPNM